MSWIRKIKALVRAIVHRELSQVRTMTVGQVVEYDAASNSAKIRLCVRQIRTLDPNNLTTVDMPILEDVPVQQFGSGKLLLSVPPAVDSYGTVLFSDRDLEAWLMAGGTVDPTSSRRWDLSDAVFIPGLYPYVVDGDNGQLEDPLPTDRIALRTRSRDTEVAVLDDETVEVKVNDDVTITIDGANIAIGGSGNTTIAMDGDVKLQRNSDHSMTVGSDSVKVDLGQAAVALAPKVTANFDLINTIISGWTPTPNDGGAAFKAAWAAAWPGGVQDTASSNLKADP